MLSARVPLSPEPPGYWYHAAESTELAKNGEAPKAPKLLNPRTQFASECPLGRIKQPTGRMT